MNCPICNSEMENIRDVLDGWCLIEDYHYCPNKCYSHQYWAGNTSICVREKEFCFYYTYPSDKQERLFKIIKRLVEREKIKFSFYELGDANE